MWLPTILVPTGTSGSGTLRVWLSPVHWNNHIGYLGYTPSEIFSKAYLGSSIGIYNGLVYDLMNGGIDVQFMDSSLINLFKYNSVQDLTKVIDNLNINSGMQQAEEPVTIDPTLYKSTII